MRTIHADAITEAVARLCEEANYILPRDVKDAIRAARAAEDWPVAQGVLDCILENQNIAEGGRIPICQDTGAACVFLELGQDVHIAGGDLARAVDEACAGLHQCANPGWRTPSRGAQHPPQHTGAAHVDIVRGRAAVTGAPKGRQREHVPAEDAAAQRRHRGREGVRGGNGAGGGT